MVLWHSVLYITLFHYVENQLWSVKLANWHFWLGTLGIIFYAVPMYISGFTQGLMWKQFNPDGTLCIKTGWIL
jgi:cytochrome c oxidase cbb3-type subunit I/II